MDVFCNTGIPPSKYRAALTSSSFYQPAPFARTHRQNDYNYTKHSRQSALLYHEQNRYKGSKPKSKICSIALATAAFIVLIVVLAVAGLALYMGALHTEVPDQILSFSCSVKIARGDRFVGQNSEKTRKYRQQLELLYRKSVIGPALMSVILERFGDDGATIYFRLSLNRSKLSRIISNIEKTLRDILINDSLTKKPVFRGIRFDARSIQIRQTLDTAHRVISKPKEIAKSPGILSKPMIKRNFTVSTDFPIKKRPVIDESEFKEEDLPVIQGSFQISKTEADITEKKRLNNEQSTHKPKVDVTKTPSKFSTLSGLLQKTFTETITPNVKKTTPILTTTTTSPISTTATTSTSTMNPTKLNVIGTSTVSNIPPIFTIPSHTFDREGWIPINKNHVNFPKVNLDVIPTVSPIELLHKKQPVYTSFTNPGLTFFSANRETLGSTSIMKHPLPIDKIAEITEATFTTVKLPETTTNDKVFTTDLNIENRYGEDITLSENNSFVEVETLEYLPGSSTTTTTSKSTTNSNEFVYATQSKWEYLNGTNTNHNRTESIPSKSYNNTLQAIIIKDEEKPSDHKLEQNMVLKNLSSIFHTLASTLGFIPMNISVNNETENEGTKMGQDESKMETEEPSLGEGQAEVVEADEESLILETHTSTKLPLVTLMPVKSNSGVLRPLRPRPKDRNATNLVENRSFPNDPFVQRNELTKDALKFVQTEVVTSVSTEINKIKIPKNQLSNYKISGELNFEPDIFIEPTTSTNKNGILQTRSSTLRNPKTDSTRPTERYHQNEEISNRDNERIPPTFHVLSEEKLLQLAAISKINTNTTNHDKEPIISNKAISASYTLNQAGLKILTKTFNKVPTYTKDEEKHSVLGLNVITTNKTECNELSVKCGDGQCLPASTRCNQLVDCNDGTDERNCNCADYLKSEYLLGKICDGVVDCWDFSDENQCEWCKPGQYVCRNSKFCIDKTKICDEIRDCPNGDDERQCVTIAPNNQAADEFSYNSEGYLFVRKFGKWGKVCVDNIATISSEDQPDSHIIDLGQAVCKTLTYRSLSSINKVQNPDQLNTKNNYYELNYSQKNSSKSTLTFKATSCQNGNTIKIQCRSLDCGARPNMVKQLARIVGGGNAGLGSWPWQAALYKEGEFQCGASLISDKWLLSAGHCFFHSLDEHWVVRLGALRRGTSLPSPYEQLKPIVRIIIHPGYVDAGFINDISLLQMESPVTFSDYVRPICLPQPNAALKDGKICTVIGWGQLFEVGRIFPDTLQEVQVPIISTMECRKRTVFLPLYKVTDDMFCAGFERGGRDACLGDSGGPLMCPELDGRWVLYGITSNGYGCARANRPGVYTKVSNYVNWIHSHMNSKDPYTSMNKTICTGHRCPLGECLPKSRLCNGFIECSDGSDEKDCLINHS